MKGVVIVPEPSIRLRFIWMCLPRCFLLCFALASSAFAQSGIDIRAEPDDKLATEERKLVADLTHRNMPELVESLLRSGPKTYYIYIARAYAAAAPEVAEQAASSKFFKRALKYYRKAIALERDAKWFKGLRRSVSVAEWRIELAEFLLRKCAATDLDRFEITSGLDFNRPQLSASLEEASQILDAAASRIEDFEIGLRTREQDFLLLGLSAKIPRLAKRHAVIAAWTNLYLGQTDGQDTPLRRNRLQTALDGFDRIASSSKDDVTRYNATIGVGIAMRELRRYAEAEIAFNRVIDSTSPSDIITRAQHEKSRMYLSMGNFDRARQEWRAMAARSDKDVKASEAFYLRLAPVMLAYTDIRAAAASKTPPSEQFAVRNRAVSSLNKIASQGGAWHELADVYLGLLDERDQDFSELGNDDLFSTATRLMANERSKEALDAWQTLLKRPLNALQQSQVLYNLGICQLALEDFAAAADAMDRAAAGSLTPDMTHRAIEVVYQCRRSISGKSPTRESYLKLAEAAQRLVDTYSESALAEEAAWVNGLALQEAGEFLQARQAFARIPSRSKYYWDARRGEALCAQSQFESEGGSVVSDARRRSAQIAVDLWRRLIADLEETSKTSKPIGRKNADSLEQIALDARLSAASLLASDTLGACKEALDVLAGVSTGARGMGIRLRCLRATGQSKQADEELASFIKSATSEGASDSLLDLAAGLEYEMDELLQQDRITAAKNSAQDAIPLLQQLLVQIEKSGGKKKRVAVIEFSLARALGVVGDLAQSREIFDRLMSESPENGEYIRAAAKMEEQASQSWTGAKRDEAADRAELLWAKLLKDSGLRERTPTYYWEARYHWLSHQLRHGRAADVLKGIESEQAWYPDLGGSEWKERLLDLAVQARAQSGDRKK